MKKLLELGISLEERNVTQEFIEKLEKLQSIGIDVSKLTSRDTIQALANKARVGLNEIEKLGLNLDDRIGVTKSSIAQAYRGNGNGTKPTEEQVKRLAELGISLEPKKRKGKEIGEASISALKDIEMADTENAALHQLMEQTKEGGVQIYE